jgi:hypothetical protein
VPSRREFLQRGLAASVLAACPRSARLVLAGGGSEEPHRLFKIVFDQTFAEGAAFGAEAVSRGAAVRAIGSDAGGVWMNEIEPRWQRGPAAVAGLGSLASLFCLELLGRDYGMGVAYCAEHSPTAGVVVHHVLIGRDRLSPWESRLTAAGKRWAAVAAAMAMKCPETLTPDPHVGLLDLARPTGIAGPSLFSWVIGPAWRAGVLGERGMRNRPRRG